MTRVVTCLLTTAVLIGAPFASTAQGSVGAPPFDTVADQLSAFLQFLLIPLGLVIVIHLARILMGSAKPEQSAPSTASNRSSTAPFDQIPEGNVGTAAAVADASSTPPPEGDGAVDAQALRRDNALNRAGITYRS